jgi:hypothetical protein
LLQTFLSEASGSVERDVALLMAEALPAGKRVTLGGDKNYDTQEFIRELRGMNITPPCGAEHHQAQERGGRANHAACGVRSEPA